MANNDLSKHHRLITVCEFDILKINIGTKEHLLITNMNEVQTLQAAGWKNEGFVFQSGTKVDVFRLYSQVTKEHFYTASINEKNTLVNSGGKYEGVTFKAN
ncbi:hypothetical protein E4T82_07130 [Streptococcus cuniculi]|uniref:DUF5648 domain-containing protein n=1 Tax=Streptococcus cuniculi TaxID=1432788 RepID=A0A4Y9JBQ3_9STRE|nr:hypothetical protein [Streptococcus cuniculi]MBF0778495.1 hypothetical protein [Streptococcus cuniculi]TFU97588.1 hypothetical protein E4T82_07130 [Streptococcus cuniculi]